MAALGAVYGRGRDERSCLKLGAVKANIGHLEAAAGVAGLIKVVLALQQGQLPPQVNFERVNPYIDLEGCRISVSRARQAWPRQAGKRRVAGLSSFGFSGTNAHVIVEEGPVQAAGCGGWTSAACGAVWQG